MKRGKDSRTLPVDVYVRGQHLDRWAEERKKFVYEAKSKPGKLLPGVLEAQESSVAVDARNAQTERGKGAFEDNRHPYARKSK